tara:strand:- start:137 stop:649 length:513 start_codon:yes stop_codon:yes gene_type:complete
MDIESSENLIKNLKHRNYVFSVYDHPPFFTVDDSKKNRGNMKGSHTKNLFLRDKKKKNFLITLDEDKLINLKSLELIINSSRLSFGSAERLNETLGVKPGSVSPLALINNKDLNVHFFLDSDLLEQETINLHPLINTKTISIKTNNLIEFLESLGVYPKFIDFKKQELSK